MMTIYLSLDLLHRSSSNTVKGFSILSDPPWIHKKGTLNSSKFYSLAILRMFDSKAHVVDVHTLPVYIKVSFFLYFYKECFVLWLFIGFMVWNLGNKSPPNIITFFKNPLLTGLSLNAGFSSMHPLMRVGFLKLTWKAINPPILSPFTYTGTPGCCWETCMTNS